MQHSSEPAARRPSRWSLAAADDLTAFVHLFEERRAAEAMPGGVRSEQNARAMDGIAHEVQRALEYLSRSWIVEDREDGRPRAVVQVLAAGTREEYEPIADEALRQLRDTATLYRSGRIDLGSGRSRRRRARVRHAFGGRRGRIAIIGVVAVILYAVTLLAFGSWDAPEAERPNSLPTTLTHAERTF